VARAAATGGGRTYRGQAPVRWYASLALISLLGVSLIAYSRYQRQHQNSTSGQAAFAALAFDVCGKPQPNLASNPVVRSVPPVVTQGDGVLHVAKSAASSATLGQFVEHYPGVQLTSSELKLPGKSTYKNGGTCASGTPDAGKHASVQVKMWPSFSGAGSNNPVSVSDPTNLKITNGQLITVAYVPQGASIPKPSGQTIINLLNLVSGQNTSSTTTPATVPISPSTTVPSITTSPSTTAPSSSTTKA
jgi:hypothetical protein